MSSIPRTVSVIVFVILTTISGLCQPRHLYLTWEEKDTAHTQTIVFQTLDKATDPRVEIYLGSKSPKVVASKTTKFRGYPRRIHWVTLRGLKAKTSYKFRAGDTRYGMSPWRSFKTLPDDNSQLKIVTGGDMYRHRETVQLLQAGSAHSPDVALVGGDIAYASGDLRRVKFWDDWFDNWENHLNQKKVRLVPIICAIGNHEVVGGFGQNKSRAPFYFGFFPQGGEPYFVRQLGSEMDLFVLDTGHVTSHKTQAPFLKEALKKSKARFKIALYHVPLYPSHRGYMDFISAQGRKHWAPLFDKYKVSVAFENHDHVFKRTFPLKANKVSEEGTVYLGEGCWGRTPRTVRKKRWYHVKAFPREHIWVLQNKTSGLACSAVDKYGIVFDRTTIKGDS